MKSKTAKKTLWAKFTAKISKTTRFKLFIWIIITLLWIGGNQLRSWIPPHCISSPSSCTRESVLTVDQLSIGMEIWQADQYSYWTQNLSGVLAFLLPMLIEIFLFLRQPRRVKYLLQAITRDSAFVLSTISLNGLMTEVAHLISQRPRPFVYLDPLHRGLDPAHYTSFYSGHSSFTAAVHVAAFFVLMNKRLPHWVLILVGMVDISLIFSTAHFRILAGRHFLTDVVCGILGGVLAAIAVRYFNDECNS